MSRVPQLNQLIKKEVSHLLLKEAEFPPDILVTVTRVETSPNLRESRIFVSTMPAIKSREVLRILNRIIYKIQQKINKRIRARPVPRLKFLEEKETSQAGRIEEILEELKKGKK
jgi:ribosome-binding factor A